MSLYVNLVRLHIRPECVAAFLEAVRANHEASLSEPGNLRFDVLRSEDDRSRFVLYEVYVSAEAAAAHRRTPHFARYRATVEPMYASPREALVCRTLHPDASETERWRG